MTCKCGFKFSEPGEYRNCDAFIDGNGQSGVICPDCGKAYINGVEVTIGNGNITKNSGNK